MMKVMWIVCWLFIKGFLFVKEIFCFKKPSPLIKVQRMLSSRSWEMFTYDFDGLQFYVSRYHNCWSRTREIFVYGKGFHFWSCFCIIIRYQDFQSGLLWDSAQFIPLLKGVSASRNHYHQDPKNWSLIKMLLIASCLSTWRNHLCWSRLR